MIEVIDEQCPHVASPSRCDDEVMTNYDHSVNEIVAARLQSGASNCAAYVAWNFIGAVWRDGGRWKCDIWQHHHHVASVVADELREIMTWASDEYGGE